MAAPDPADDLEDLLAEALAKFDEGGEPALAAFVIHATFLARLPRRLERAARRAREEGSR